MFARPVGASRLAAVRSSRTVSNTHGESSRQGGVERRDMGIRGIVVDGILGCGAFVNPQYGTNAKAREARSKAERLTRKQFRVPLELDVQLQPDGRFPAWPPWIRTIRYIPSSLVAKLMIWSESSGIAGRGKSR